jgi:hypothetical protein
VAARYAALPFDAAVTATRPEAPPASSLGADNATVERLVSEKLGATC